MSREIKPGSLDRKMLKTQHKALENDRVIRIEEPQSTESQAAAWLARLDGSDVSDEDLQAFKHWVNQHETHIAAFEKATAIWDDLNVLTRLPLVLQQRVMQQQTLERQQQSRSNGQSRLRWASAFAAAATLIVSIFLALQLNPDNAATASHWTAVGEQKAITLPDHSVVQLNTNSRIQVDYSGQNRAIYLYQGEAHFDVKPDPQRPFEVYAGSGLVRAIGTAFSVMLNDHEIDVIVTEGVVEIAPEISSPVAATKNPVITDTSTQQPNPALNKRSSFAAIRRVEAGNAVVFDQNEIKQVQLVGQDEMRRRLAWHEGLLIFSGEPLEDVVEQISRYTDIKIRIKSEKARKLRIGGQFQVGDTRAIFSALEKGFGLKIDYVTNSLVYISYKS